MGVRLPRGCRVLVLVPSRLANQEGRTRGSIFRIGPNAASKSRDPWIVTRAAGIAAMRAEAMARSAEEEFNGETSRES
jgi:hypothetical protein